MAKLCPKLTVFSSQSKDSLVKKRRLISDEDPENELEETLFQNGFFALLCFSDRIKV